MLWNRSRAALMADQTSFLSPTKNLSTSPKKINGHLTKDLSNSETTSMSPTSKYNFVNPFVNVPKPQTPFPKTINSCNDKAEAEAIGLALIYSLNQDDGKMALFRSKLKGQTPAISESPESPADTRTKGFSRQLSLKEMELSEDYTCVITYGPNKKTTHIYENCIVESCCGENNKISDHSGSNFAKIILTKEIEDASIYRG